jgi:membrane-bound lytic murein transglycosylase B
MPSSFRSYAVDGDADGKRDLWNDWPDVFSSVGNYLKVHGWKAGEPVLAAADASNADLAGLSDKLALTETVGSLRARGLKFETSLPANAPAMLVALKVAAGTEYRVGFTNFYAITRYNRSHMYASAVSDLADAIVATRAGQPLPAASRSLTPAPLRPTEPASGWSTTAPGT